MILTHIGITNIILSPFFELVVVGYLISCVLLFGTEKPPTKQGLVGVGFGFIVHRIRTDAQRLLVSCAMIRGTAAFPVSAVPMHHVGLVVYWRTSG